MLHEYDDVISPDANGPLPYDLHLGLRIDKPELFVRWSLSKVEVTKLLSQVKGFPVKTEGKDCGVSGASVFGLEKLYVGIVFVLEGSCISLFNFKREVSRNTNELEIYNETQLSLEKLFGNYDKENELNLEKRWEKKALLITHAFWTPPWSDILYDTVYISRK